MATIFHGKSIVTCDKDDNVYTYLVEDGGKIAYVGNDLPDIFKSNSATHVELGDRALIPSFGDGHLHFSNWALIAASFFDVRTSRTLKEMQCRLTLKNQT